MPHLTEELLQKILWRLKLSTDSHNTARDENRILTNTLLSCLLASKKLSRLAKPVLYHTINTSTDNLFTLAQHLAYHPDLASQVCELYVDENGSQYVGVMGEDDDREWPEYLRNRLSACRSCWTERHSPEDVDKYGFTMPIAAFFLMVCTGIHTLVLHDYAAEPQALSHHFIEDCMDLGHEDPHAPLASLRNVDLRYPTVPLIPPEPTYWSDDEMEPNYEREGYV